jgi:DNA-binding response OmpR family regulator
MLTQSLEMLSPVARHSVLIIEDDEAMAEILSDRLTRQGFAAHAAGSGKMGLELAKTRRPDCILLDLGLPDIDGFEVCQELVDSPRTYDIPVIIISGLDRSDVIRRSRAAGCHYYVRKPYDPNALLTLIRRAIDDTQV